MWFTFVLLQLLPQFALSAHCPSRCICDIRGFAKCTGDITDVPPLDPTRTFQLLLTDTNIKILKDRSLQPFSLLLRLMITEQSNLEQLQLDDNQITSVSSELFEAMVNLTELNLNKNQIPPRLFWPLPSLFTLSMSANQLRYIPAESFYYLPNLTKLTLFKNPLISLPYQLMGHMPKLQELYLYETNLSTLTYLPKNLFCCLPKLNKLSLKYNNLQELDPELFSNLISLQILMLNENKLETLDLNHNHLRYLPGDVFVHAMALKNISLSGNKWNCDCSIMGIAEWIHENPERIGDLDKGVTCYEPYRLENHPLQTLTYEKLHCGGVDVIRRYPSDDIC
uniref:Si:ch211-117l17.7 n=1 Tax=Cyprinus carpio TaxID=7962 RepID=A0A8C2PZ45_CYPCA